MKSICLFFQVHNPIRLKIYRFFDIGNDHYYYDDFTNEYTIRDLAEKCYLPTNEMLLELFNVLEGKLKVSFSISGIVLEQLELYAPEVIDSFQKLAKTGCVEFVSETFSHTLASLVDPEVFKVQVKMHKQKIIGLFRQKPVAFINTEMIYSDQIGEHIANLGFNTVLTEGPKHILGWKSPNYLYVNALNPRLKVLMRNFKLSDDISFRFSDAGWAEFPLTAEKFLDWISGTSPNEEVFNLFMNYETFGKRQTTESGVFEFFKSLSQQVVACSTLKFSTPSEIAEELQPVSAVSVPKAISWADEERDITPWIGNAMQKEAFKKLYALSRKIERCNYNDLLNDWNYLQSSDHFLFMSTKFNLQSNSLKLNNPYDSPYEAFMNYMNILSDFKIRLDALVPDYQNNTDIFALQELLDKKNDKIKKLEAKLKKKEKQ